jgi:hypothetical protein
MEETLGVLDPMKKVDVVGRRGSRRLSMCGGSGRE